jgi:ferredoxin
MKVKLDPDVCDAHGDCVVAAPEIFDLGDDDEIAKVLIEEPDEELHDKAREAADACPVQAITIEE